MADPVYALGHTDRELERLSAQERLVGPTTRQFFREAGIGAGMRVLDVGSGAGDVAFLAADLVGATGEVIGADRVPAAVAAAAKRARERGLDNVSFREGDPAEMSFDRPFDAVVGRYVLLFQADVAATLRQLARHLRPGGTIVFHEPDLSCVRSIPPAPTYDRCVQWIAKTFRLVGTEANMASRLHQAFVGAGLPAPTMRMQTLIGGGAGCADWLHAVADLAASLVPAMERLGVATAAEVGVATLAERMRQEVSSSDSVIIGRSEIAAWAHRE
jgi:SAM-dependent methyltransferase